MLPSPLITISPAYILVFLFKNGVGEPGLSSKHFDRTEWKDQCSINEVLSI